MELNISQINLNTPENFNFPFQPYSIQNEFMKNLFELIESKKLGIFESPTGTVSNLFQILLN